MAIQRQARGRISPYENGQGSEFIIPPDMMPDRLESGEDMEIVIDGVLNIDKETGQGTIYVNKFMARKKNRNRTDPIQDKLEAAAREVMQA